MLVAALDDAQSVKYLVFSLLLYVRIVVITGWSSVREDGALRCAILVHWSDWEVRWRWVRLTC